MGKSCFDGYLTPACKDCPDWGDGVTKDYIGCGTHVPIMWCPDFAAMYNAAENKDKEVTEE